MESFIKYSLPVALLLWLTSCIEEPQNTPDPIDALTDMEEKLVGNWVYDHILIESISNPEFFPPIHNHTTNRLEPRFSDLNGNGGEGARLFRRLVEYDKEKIYQLQWLNRGEYELGTEGDPNWQPNFGYWKINESNEGVFLVHNNASPYETRYRIIGVDENKLVRQSVRYMSEAGHIHEIGDSVLFTETFIRQGQQLSQPAFKDKFDIAGTLIPIRLGYHVAKISYSEEAIDGSHSIKLDFPGNVQGANVWGGLILRPREFIFGGTRIDISSYANGYLVFALKHDASLDNLEIKLESENFRTQTVRLKDHTPSELKNGWKEYRIPLKRFTELGLNLERIDIPFGLWNPMTANGDLFQGEILVDNIHFRNRK